MLDPPHPDIASKPAAARLAIATSSKHPSHGLPAFLMRRMRRMKPSGSRIRAANSAGSTVPAGSLTRAAVAVPVVPIVSVVVSAEEEGTVRLVGANVHVTFEGSVPQAKLTVPVNPPVGVSVITVDPVEPVLMVSEDGFALSV